MSQPSRKILLALLALVVSLAACTKPKVASRIESKKDCAKPENVGTEGCPAPDPEPEDDEAPEGDGGETDGEPPPPPPEDFLKDVTPLSDEDAVAFLKEQCLDCHDSKNGSVRSFWPLDKDNVDVKKLSTDTMAPTVFWATLSKAKDIVGGKPSAMPPRDLEDADHKKLLSFVKWMTLEMPAVVSEAQARFGAGGKTKDGGVGVILNFKCGQPATFREYIRRFTNDAFDREPTADELQLAGHPPEEPTTAADRKLVAERLMSEWKDEFVEKGLHKFASKLAGTGDIKPIAGMITDAQATALKDEFYQLLKKYWETKAYKDILLGDKVMVNADTSALYDNCNAPGSGWAECTMESPRGSYFTSVGYLLSKPSSFLRENNNYGRAALMFFIVRGDVFRAAFDQDGGAEEVKDLPACLKSKDYRGKKTGTAIAWRGSMAIPSSANLCQSCHIERQMAAGSILFRPFNPGGLIYGITHPLNTDPDFAQATAPEIVNKIDLTGPDQVVNEAFLQALLDTSAEEAACVPGRGSTAEVSLSRVKDLAKFLIGDGRVLAGGLARHLPRSLSNLDNTSEEIIVKFNQAFQDGGGKLAPVFKAYFSSETYACKR